MIWLIQFALVSKAVWSNYRSAGRMWPATAFSVPREAFRKTLKFGEKRVRLRLSHWTACTG